MAWVPQKDQLWHEMMADLLVLDPTLTNEQIAEQLGLHPQTVRAVRAGDMFKALVERRRERIAGRVEDNYMARLQGKVGALAEVAVDTLTQQVKTEQAKMVAGVQQGTLETCDMALRALGFISKGNGAAPPAPHHLTVVVNNDVLSSAREKMRTIHANASSGAHSEAVSDPALLPAPVQLP